jgi:hypothetical protein
VSAETLCEELKQWGRLCALIEMLWHLSEILLFSKSNHNVLLTLPLVDWLNYHFPLTLPDLDVISSTTKPEEHPDYWTLFFRLLLYGRTTECRDLLRQHSQYVEMTSTNTAHNPFIILDVRRPYFSFFLSFLFLSLTSSHLISSHLISSHLISSHLTSLQRF